MSNVKFGSSSSKVSVETSYRGIGKSHMVLQKSAMKELRRRLFFTQQLSFTHQLPLPEETGTHVPHGHSFQQLW